MEPSTEVRAMEARERRKWLTVAEAQKVAAAWKGARDAIDAAADKLAADPEDETEATIFIAMAAILIQGFGQSAFDAAGVLKELMDSAPREGAS